MERKNPLGLVEAFRRAFRNDDRVQLCIKVSRGEFHPENLAKLNAACKIVNGVVLNHVLPRGDVLALLANADCYASLHRAEGLGLGLAESMLLGTPVVATRYSGNLDFMDGSTAKLVDCREVEIVDTPPYPAGSHWAEPDVDHAAACLRDLFERRDEAAAMADRGRDAVQRILSVKAAGARMAQRLRERRQS
jgi:glycosyltransferase involved in cell wall biosynthesis